MPLARSRDRTYHDSAKDGPPIICNRIKPILTDSAYTNPCIHFTSIVAVAGTDDQASIKSRAVSTDGIALVTNE